MEILTPQEVNNDKAKADTERQARMIALHEEETNLIKSINALRESEKAEKERIAKEYAAADEQIKARIKELNSTVIGLEARKKEAEKPVRDALAEIEVERKKNTDRSKELDSREQNVRKREENVALRESEIPKVEQQIREKEAAADAILAKAVSEAEMVDKEAKKLANDRGIFHREMESKGEIINEREKNVKLAEAANEKVKGGLETWRDELARKEKQLADGYATLSRAMERLTKQKNG